jgi:hypothetical protein
MAECTCNQNENNPNTHATSCAIIQETLNPDNWYSDYIRVRDELETLQRTLRKLGQPVLGSARALDGRIYQGSKEICGKDQLDKAGKHTFRMCKSPPGHTDPCKF